MTDRQHAANEALRNLAVALVEKHYPDAPGWKVSDDPLTAVLQVDNVTAGLVRPDHRFWRTQQFWLGWSTGCLTFGAVVALVRAVL